jgi:hypothetical protein
MNAKTRAIGIFFGMLAWTVIIVIAAFTKSFIVCAIMAGIALIPVAGVLATLMWIIAADLAGYYSDKE